MKMLKDDEEDLKTRTIFKLEHIKELLDACLYKSYFLWDDQIHCLEDSGPIGLSLMVVLAESFLQMIEKNALHIARNLPEPVNPITHRRYVDDTHDRFNNKENSEQFLKILRDGAKFMGYPGRVLGKYHFEKKSWPPFFIMKKSWPVIFLRKIIPGPLFFQGKKS